jgi:choline dehydrogenase-like flavoprotein
MFPWENFEPPAPEGELWDVVIVGAGMGGSTVGLSLAKQGLSVLFLERGRPASRFTWGAEATDADLEARGVWPRRFEFESDGKKATVCLMLGTGPGGSSAIYGAALERLRRIDFTQSHHEGNGTKPMPDGWPLDYDAFAAYYHEAEQLFGVRGTPDPSDPDDNSALRTPPPLSERDAHFLKSFEALGLSPYRLHVGIEYKTGCTECLGLPCPNDCKAEGSSRALKPALSEHGAQILFDCEVVRLAMSDNQVEHVMAQCDGRILNIRGRVVILAAGALSTPVLLINSSSDRWPRGIGNNNDLVGRGLMFHASDFIALWPRAKVDSAGPGKTLSSRAFYVVDGKKLGGLQSVGLRVTSSTIHEFLRSRYGRYLPLRVPLVKVALKAATRIIALCFREAALFATIVEDFPYWENRIYPDRTGGKGSTAVKYERTKELTSRFSMMRRVLRSRLAHHRPFFLTGPEILNFGHPCGTCRFGSDPTTSVLNSENQVHGVSNLYVVDASFFPSSGGANPSLTVAANALRVAGRIAARLATASLANNSTSRASSISEPR